MHHCLAIAMAGAHARVGHPPAGYHEYRIVDADPEHEEDDDRRDWRVFNTAEHR